MKKFAFAFVALLSLASAWAYNTEAEVREAYLKHSPTVFNLSST